MPSRETPSYSSTRVQRASRLNALEQARLQHRLVLLEKARLHQARLTNQDIRLTSLALDYILNCSGHSPEGRGPEGQQGGVETAPSEEDPCFLYGERVVSRKVRRMPRPQSAVERATFRRSTTGTTTQDGGGSSGASSACGDQDSGGGSVHSRLPPRPQSSPAKGRSWGWMTRAEQDDGSDAESERPQSRGKKPAATTTTTPPAASTRPSTAGSGEGGGGGWRTPLDRDSPRQAWEDDTDEVTRRILRQQQQQPYKHHQKQQALRADRYLQDLSRLRSGQVTTPRGAAKQSRGASPFGASPRVPSPGSPSMVIEDRKPVSPKQRRAKSAGVGRRAGLTELMSQARATMSANAWRSHLTSTQTVPRSLESQRQVILEAKKNAEQQRQQHVMRRVSTFIGEINRAT